MLWIPETSGVVSSGVTFDPKIGTSDDFTVSVRWWCINAASTKVLTAVASVSNMLLHAGGTGFRWRVAGTYIISFGPTTAATNKWYHVLVTRRAGVVYGYVDGVELASASDSNAYPTGTLYLGTTSGTSTPRGGLCDFGIFRRACGKANAQAIHAGERCVDVLGPAVVYAPCYGDSMRAALDGDEKISSFHARWAITNASSGRTPAIVNGERCFSRRWVQPTPRHAEAAAPPAESYYVIGGGCGGPSSVIGA